MGGIDWRYRWQAMKIFHVECEEMRDTVNLQHRGEVGIVDLNAADSIGLQEVFPSRIDTLIFRQQRESSFKNLDLFGQQTEAVAIRRPCADVPELADILRRKAEIHNRCAIV